MKELKKAWDWLNGKKTIIGLIGMNIMQMNLDFVTSMNPDLKILLLWAFGALAGGGLLHKGKKSIIKK